MCACVNSVLRIAQKGKDRFPLNIVFSIKISENITFSDRV